MNKIIETIILTMGIVTMLIGGIGLLTLILYLLLDVLYIQGQTLYKLWDYFKNRKDFKKWKNEKDLLSNILKGNIPYNKTK